MEGDRGMGQRWGEAASPGDIMTRQESPAATPHIPDRLFFLSPQAEAACRLYRRSPHPRLSPYLPSMGWNPGNPRRCRLLPRG